MEQTILIGKILKPQGIKGELKINPLTSRINRFKALNYVLIEDKKYNITSVRVGVDGFVYLTLSEVTDRNMAETLRNKELYILRSDSIKLNKDEFFIDDLMHSVIYSENNKEIGEIINIENYGSADIITVACGFGDSFSFPLLKDLIISLDAENKKIIINEEKLKEIKVWE